MSSNNGIAAEVADEIMALESQNCLDKDIIILILQTVFVQIKNEAFLRHSKTLDESLNRNSGGA